jgi:hypothetical protein
MKHKGPVIRTFNNCPTCQQNQTSCRLTNLSSAPNPTPQLATAVGVCSCYQPPARDNTCSQALADI